MKFYSGHPRWVCFILRTDLKKCSITFSCSPIDPLQWMGAARMKGQTADKKHHNNHNKNILWSEKLCVCKGESQISVLPLPISFARSRESKGCPYSGFDRGVGVSGRSRYPLKPRIFASLLETKGYPEHTAARSSREYFRLK